MVSVLPSPLVRVGNVPASTPPLISALPPTVRLCTPSRALKVKLPVCVSSAGFAALPSLRFASSTTISLPVPSRPPSTTPSAVPVTLRVRVAVSVSPSPSTMV
ncbi:hypothetical protein D3C86_1445190 [compost metagenome]